MMKKFDVVVIGSGAAGMMAAWKAVEAGLSCAILEKGKNIIASNAARCGGPSLADTYLQKEQNATVTPQQLFSHMYKFSKGTVHAGLLRNAIKKGSEVESVLVKAGIKMTLLEDTYGVGFRARQLFTTSPANRWRLLAEFLSKQGAEIFLQMEAERLNLDKSGKVKGITVKNLTEDKEEEICAKAVIVATGGVSGK